MGKRPWKDQNYKLRPNDDINEKVHKILGLIANMKMAFMYVDEDSQEDHCNHHKTLICSGIAGPVRHKFFLGHQN